MAWAAIGAAAVSVVGSYIVNKKNKSSNKAVQQAQAAGDPYGPYRDAAAQKLNDLMANPDKIKDTPEYKARTMAAQRLMASQGYTGSGNALLSVADAGGEAYQQAFNNLAMLSGAGGQPGYGAMQGAAIQSGNNQYATDQYGQIANGVIGAGMAGYRNYQQNQAWNQPIDYGSGAPTPNTNLDTSVTIDNSGYTPPPVTTV